MKAMILNRTSLFKDNKTPLELVDIPIPEPKKGEVLVKISVCGVCHTELDEIEGRISPMKLPVVPGHQVVGTVAKLGPGATKFGMDDRVGVAWIFSACGHCEYCLAGNENLCDDFLATGKDVNGGYAEYMTVPEKYAHRIPDAFENAVAAPLLCAGAVGYRSLKLAKMEDGDRLGLTGFGNSGHLVLQMARFQYPNSEIHVFARREEERQFALDLGASWAGDTDTVPPEKLNAIIDTTPVWKPVVEALGKLAKGGRLVINAIRKEESDKDYLQHLSYHEDLWSEKEVKSVANVTAEDVSEFLKLAAKAQIRPEVQHYPLEDANMALLELKEQHIRGGKVLLVDH